MVGSSVGTGAGSSAPSFWQHPPLLSCCLMVPTLPCLCCCPGAVGQQAQRWGWVGAAHQPHHYHPLPQELQGLNGFQQVSAQLTGSACSPAAASHHTVHRCLWPLVSWHGSSFPFLAGLLLLGCSCLEVAPFLEVSLAGWVSTALGLSWACMEGGWCTGPTVITLCPSGCRAWMDSSKCLRSSLTLPACLLLLAPVLAPAGFACADV